MTKNPLYNILNQYAYEINEKKSTKAKQVVTIKAKDKAGAQKEIETKLSKDKFVYYRKKDNALSGSTEVTVIDYNHLVKGGSVILVFKPASGGMNETTLNSTITELAPALAFEGDYKPKSVEDFYSFLKSVDHKKSNVYVAPDNRKAGEDYVNQFPESSKFKEKMENAMGVLKYLYEEHKKRPIAKVYWGYRQKPPGVDGKHKGDLFLEYKNGKMLGVSLKAGEEGSSEPKLNTYVNVILEEMDMKKVNDLRLKLWNKTYKSFSKDKFYYDKGPEKKEVLKKLEAFERNDLKEYEKMYDNDLEIIRDTLMEVFEKNTKKTVDYLNKAIVGKDESVPLLVIKAYGTNYKILTDEDDVAVFLPKTKSVKCMASPSSKQDFFIELTATAIDRMTLKFSVRTNKTGSEHKLGQFYNLAVKFNGVK